MLWETEMGASWLSVWMYAWKEWAVSHWGLQFKSCPILTSLTYSRQVIMWSGLLGLTFLRAGRFQGISESFLVVSTRNMRPKTSTLQLRWVINVQAPDTFTLSNILPHFVSSVLDWVRLDYHYTTERCESLPPKNSLDFSEHPSRLCVMFFVKPRKQKVWGGWGGDNWRSNWEQSIV